MNTLERLALKRDSGELQRERRLENSGLARQPVSAVDGARVRVSGRWLLSFTSAHYLGINRHPRITRALAEAALRWGVSLGAPRALAVDRQTCLLEQELARLVGQESALLYPSTTHAALDLLPLLVGENGALFVDAWAYPISLEGVAAAAQRGAKVYTFPHNDCRALARLLSEYGQAENKVIVCDGIYPADGRPAALGEIDRLAKATGAALYVDDAHGLGVLGKDPAPGRPFGSGGGGTPAYLSISPGNLVHVASLAKAFGVPLAFAAGPETFIDHLRIVTPAHTHSSPPAIPLVTAALAALRVHAACGEARRARLDAAVRRFRAGNLRAGGTLESNPHFPLQIVPVKDAGAAAHALLKKGIWAIPQKDNRGLLFVLTARHTQEDVDEAIHAIVTLGLPQEARLGARKNKPGETRLRRVRL